MPRLMAATCYNLKKLLKWINSGAENDPNSLVGLLVLLWRTVLQIARISAFAWNCQQRTVSLSIIQPKAVNISF